MESAIRDAVTKAIQELGVKDLDFSVKHPNDLSHGDYATNAALIVAQKLKKNPHEVAEKMVQLTELNALKGIEKVEIAGPGFINFFLHRDFFSEKIAVAIELEDDWGKNDSWKGKKVVVEYTDPNPFKEFHVGHLFTNAVGESIARLFMMAGADTKRVNYQGDVGLHVAYAIWGMQELGFAGARDFTARELGKAYALGATTYKENEEAKETIHTINRAIYARSDEVVNTLYDKGRDISLRYFETIYALLDTRFDEYFFESEAGPKGKELVLANPDVFEASDGAKVFKGENYGLHTRVFLNSEGLPTYEAKELALAKLKEEKLGAYNHSVIATSNEITEYFKVLKKAMSFIYPELEEKTEHIGHGTVRLSTGKMSSRTGDVTAALDFIHEIAERAKEKMRETQAEPNPKRAEEIAIGAIKYATLKSSIFQDSVFNKEQALSFEGDSGPYLMYTHARIVSVLEKAKEAGIRAAIKNVPGAPYEVERLLYRFPEVITHALNEREPHYVAGFLIELAGAFNTFYAREKIVDTEDEYAPYKLALASAVKTTLKNGLWILAIKAPEHM